MSRTMEVFWALVGFVAVEVLTPIAAYFAARGVIDWWSEPNLPAWLLVKVVVSFFALLLCLVEIIVFCAGVIVIFWGFASLRERVKVILT